MDNLTVDHKALGQRCALPTIPQAPTAMKRFISDRDERKEPSGFQEQRHNLNPDWGILVKAIVRLDTLP
jgi:hypothetical protein